MCVLSMVSRQPDHVYGLVGRMADRGLERVSFGSLYPLVNRLRQQGLLHDTSVASPVGPPRTVLSLTSAGEAALARWSRQWHNLNAAVGRLLEPLEPRPGTTSLQGGGAR